MLKNSPRNLLHIFLFLFLSNGISAQASQSRFFRQVASDETQENRQHENEAWNNYVKSFQLSDYQNGCEPRKFLPAPGIKTVSKILLVHGFTACTQQYYEWAELLNQRGVAVYLFVMPGHGKKLLSDGKDNFSDFPSHNNFKDYSLLAELINKVAISDDLPSSIGGLSVGGAVALHAAAIASTPYEKVILFSPFFKMPTYLQRHLFGPIVGNIPGLRNKVIGWGAGCLYERSKGRAGICTFSVSDVYTTQLYGQYVISLTEKLSPTTMVQIVGINKDPGSDDTSTRKVARLLNYKNNPRVSVCFYPRGINHSLLSRFDTPDENKFWLPALLTNATNFIDRGEKIPSQPSSIDDDFEACPTP